jgi:hypothetical protein
MARKPERLDRCPGTGFYWGRGEAGWLIVAGDGSVKVVSAWQPYIKNYMPNNGFDVGGRLMAAWIDK